MDNNSQQAGGWNRQTVEDYAQENNEPAPSYLNDGFMAQQQSQVEESFYHANYQLQQQPQPQGHFPLDFESSQDFGSSSESTNNVVKEQPSFLPMLEPVGNYEGGSGVSGVQSSEAIAKPPINWDTGYMEDIGGNIGYSMTSYQAANPTNFQSTNAVPPYSGWSSKYLPKKIAYLAFWAKGITAFPYTLETIYSVLQDMEPKLSQPSSPLHGTKAQSSGIAAYTPLTLLKRWESVEYSKYQTILGTYTKYNLAGALEASIKMVKKSQAKNEVPMKSAKQKFTIHGWTDKLMEVDVFGYITKYIICEHALEFAAQNPNPWVSTTVGTKLDYERLNMDEWIKDHRILSAFICKLAVGLALTRDLPNITDLEFNTATGISAIMLYLMRKYYRYEGSSDYANLPRPSSISKWLGDCIGDVQEDSYRCMFISKEIEHQLLEILPGMVPYISTYL
ncbi:hypothetical protein H4219_003941 [Mycoemilia scoparia]|uniref:Uncharacterized protein n=1 Tax=Mycoemilia scoparia TaxID=417184 RepID=A0A9W7ZU50_9FUNG|nr:hypothetical protein H4219_003941 [Mycoemilia scoparia]